MLKKALTIIYILFSAILLFYLALPNFNFPKPPPDSVQSKEPADMETPLRRAYFTNLTRQQVLDWYMSQFKNSPFKNIPLPTELLNYPPENSGTIIRDQTRSTFLQEIVHPFRENVFINGYEPAPDDDKDRIVIDGTHWRQKIIIRYVPSNTALRVIIYFAMIISIPILYLAYSKDYIFLLNLFRNKNKK